MINNILISRETRKVLSKDNRFIGIEGENLQEVLVFNLDEEIEGSAIIEIQFKDGTKGFIELDKTERGYELPIKSSLLTQKGLIKMQLRIVQSGQEVFKSEIIRFDVDKAINATATIPDEYPTWIDNLGILKLELQKAENERIKAEQDRVNAENERVRSFSQMGQDVENAIKEIEDKKADYNDNALKKVAEYDKNAQDKLDVYNANTTNKIKEFNDNVTTQTNTFNKNAETQITEYNENAQVKIDEYNTNAEELINRIAYLETENTTIKNQIPTGEEEGNPIHLADSSDMECEIYPIGNAEQEIREGTNIIDFNVTQNSKVTVNDDGTLTINGTGGFNLNIKELTLKAGETYYQKFKLLSGSITGTTSIFMGFNGSSWISSSYFTTYTPTEDIVKSSIWINASAVFENAVIQLWGNTDQSDFEQYGASPSLDYPSEIETVGQNVNIFDGEMERGNINNETGENQNETWSVVRSKNYINVKGLKNITLRLVNGSNTVIFFNKDKNILSHSQTTTEKTRSVELPADCEYIRFYEWIVDVTSPRKIEKGTVATSYSPHGQGSVEIEVCTKNQFDVDKLKALDSGNSYETYNGVECLKLKGTVQTYPLKGKDNTQYTFQLNIVGWTYPTIGGFVLKYSDGTSTAYYPAKDETGKISITSKEDKTLTAIIWNGWSQGNYVYIDKNSFQLEVGTRATEVVAHESQIKSLPIQEEMVKIGDCQDTFIKKDGKWFEAHYTKVVLNGNQTMVYYDAPSKALAANFSTAYFTITGMEEALRNEFLSNRFRKTYTTATDIWGIAEDTDKKEGIFIESDKTIRLRLKKELLTGYNEELTATEKVNIAKEYLKNNNIIIYYPLVTPKLIPCTPEQEEVLNSFYTYKNITNIRVSGIGTLKVKYKKDLETILNNINTAIVSLGGV